MTLKGRQDGFKLIIPENFICDEIKDKYAKIIQDQKSFAYRPIDYLNETIQSIQILGFLEGTVPQQQTGRERICRRSTESYLASRLFIFGQP